jgi:ADP-heptose:LPS heptosyltransferase
VIGSLPPTCRILVARLDSLGDCVLSSSFFMGLRKRFPRAHLTGGFSALTAPLFEHSPLFDRILSMPAGAPSSWRSLLEAPYDLAICPRWDVDYWSTRHLAMLSQAPVRVGFERGPYRYDQINDGWAGAYFTDLARTRSELHEVLKGQDLLGCFGIDGPPLDPRLWIPETSARWAADFVEHHRLGRFAVLAVSAASKHRIWPVQNFLPVVDALHRAGNRRFVVVGAQDAVESGAWLRRMRPEAVVCATGTVPLLFSAALIAVSDLYIGMDTGPMHLAAASHVPVVEISCHPVTGGIDHPNSPKRFGPYATCHRILQPLQPLMPCVDGCDVLDSPHCITQIHALQVIEAAQQLLEE